MKVHLAYGETGLDIEVPDRNLTVLEPEFVPSLHDEEGELQAALGSPLGTPPFRQLAEEACRRLKSGAGRLMGGGAPVAIVFCDVTRPIPTHKLLSPLLEELRAAGFTREDVVLINALGMHRRNTAAELKAMLGDEIFRNYRVLQDQAGDSEAFGFAGRLASGHDIFLNKHYLSAGLRILTGFIEPHLFAGMSGGAKLLLPGIAREDNIMYFHSAQMIGHPRSTLAVMEGNPVQETIREVGRLAPPDFILNVALNKHREITAIFAGALGEAHAAGVSFVSAGALRPVPQLFDIVITTNSGYPLDMNLYQSVKGLVTARRVVKERGTIILAAECREGLPEHGNFKAIMKRDKSPRAILDLVFSPGFSMRDQWEAQALCNVLERADVYIKSSGLSPEDVETALCTPIKSIERALEELLRRYGQEASVCVLPEGPQTVPYVV
ncbi:MAG: nickel-dependent lactate racemase [Firmicutes bacterium]|nr:nickel-dependent lactate racemase [Bacillota bacterium]